MKRSQSLMLLMATGFMLVSCNEKISPSLQNSGVGTTSGTTSGGTTGGTVEKKFIELVDTSFLAANFKMHKTGYGNQATKCRIEEEVFSTASFQNPSLNPIYDISCFLEAEEWSLYYNDVELTFNASPDICEYIVYEPYNFYQYQPGSSSKSVEIYKCAGGASGSDIVDGAKFGHTALASAGCNQIVDTNPDLVPPTPWSYFSDANLCDFDYSNSGGPNCDAGVVSVTEYTYTKTDDGAGAVSWAVNSINRLHACGGNPLSCRAGSAFKTLPAGKSGISTKTVAGESVSLKNLIPNSFGNSYGTNISVANYVRQCSGAVDNTSDFSFQPASLADEVPKKTFDPLVLDRYTNGRTYWSGVSNIFDLFTTKFPFSNLNVLAPRLSPGVHNKDLSLGRTRLFYAADSFLSTTIAAAKPFYTFYCLNNNLETKARIRLAIRDWDQLFDPSTDNELLSDVFYKGSASPELGFMDTDGVELPEDDNPFNDKNDVYDWDDFLSGSKGFNDRCSGPDTGVWYRPELFIKNEL